MSAYRDIAQRRDPVSDGGGQVGQHLAAVMAAAALFERGQRLGQPRVNPPRSAKSPNTRAPTGATVYSGNL